MKRLFKGEAYRPTGYGIKIVADASSACWFFKVHCGRYAEAVLKFLKLR
ncbi:MAG: hypothetical protein LBJ00_05550 [Planctomycetaceae bacterium]|jgi:hypothetical protein|nr:hypothetical protein [Planctomycetaceae bacterium]